MVVLARELDAGFDGRLRAQNRRARNHATTARRGKLGASASARRGSVDVGGARCVVRVQRHGGALAIVVVNQRRRRANCRPPVYQGASGEPVLQRIGIGGGKMWKTSNWSCGMRLPNRREAHVLEHDIGEAAKGPGVSVPSMSAIRGIGHLRLAAGMKALVSVTDRRGCSGPDAADAGGAVAQPDGDGDA